MTSFIGALVLAGVHVTAGKLRFLDVLPRSRWLSIAGGVAVAYALIHLLPELQQYHAALEHTVADTGLAFAAEHVAWMLVLLGLVVFYGVEKAALKTKTGSECTPVFWVHISVYAIYNACLGYLLVRENRDVWSLALFVLGIGLHFVVNDHGLRQHHPKSYHQLGRWVLSAAILGGWLVGIITEIHEAVTALMMAFLTGGILLNTFKEELPKERESRFGAFAAGAFGYTLLMLMV